MKKTKIATLILLSSALILTACSTTKTEAETTQSKEKPSKATAKSDAEKLNEFGDSITGGAFVKTTAFDGDKGIMIFHPNHASYKEENPDSNVSEEDYSNYFNTGDAIEKIMVGESVRILREFPEMNAIAITLPFEGQTYKVNLEREAANEYLGLKIEDLSVKDGSWTDKFTEPYLYDEDNRKEFFYKFIQVL